MTGESQEQWPNICVLLLTYNRLEYAQKTLSKARENLRYSGNILWHIADDGSPEEYRAALIGTNEVTVSNSQRGGYGPNYNLALQVVHSYADIILPLEDDWELTRELDLDTLVEALQEGKFGCIRMGYIGYTQELRGKFLSAAGQQFLLLDPESPEPHVWAGHPRLETRDWERYVGPWPENPDLDPGTTEFLVAQRKEARQGVVWPIDLIHPRGDLWAHIGTQQARTDQREAINVQ